MPETRDAAARVVAAARDLFAERGYAATTTRAIAERAGVNEVTLFRRFENKAGVLRAISEAIAAQAAGMAAGSTPAPAAADDPVEVRAWLRELARSEVAAAVQNGVLALRLAIEARWVPEVAAVLDSGTSANLAGMTGYLSACQRAGTLRDDLPADLLAEGFFSLTSTLVMSRQLLGSPALPAPGEVDALVDQLMTLFLSGAAPTPPGRSTPPSTPPARPSRPPTRATDAAASRPARRRTNPVEEQ